MFDLLSASGKGKRKSSAPTTPASTTATPSQRKRKLLEAETPSKKRGIAAVDGGDNNNNNNNNGQGDADDKDVPFTPSAQRSGKAVVRTRRYSLTPASSAKKFYLSRFFASPAVGSFATIPEEGHEGDPAENKGRDTPSKPKSGLETPSFLRRRNLFSARGAHRSRAVGTGRSAGTGTGTAERGNGELSPAAVRMPPRVMGKGLSTLVQGLRDMEDQRMDDDMDVLKDIEEEEGQRNDDKNHNVSVEDSQLPINREGEGEGEGKGEGENEESPSKSRKKLKKRGQKRTTRLVKMRPTRAPSKPQPQWEDTPEEDEDKDEQSEDELAADTTAAASPAKGVADGIDAKKPSDNTRTASDEHQDLEEADDGAVKGRNYEDDDIDDEDFAPEESIADAISKSRKRGYSAVKKSLTAKGANTNGRTNNDGITNAETKKKTRKVKSEAHANYRALKIRGRGGGGAGKGRFGGRFRGKR